MEGSSDRNAEQSRPQGQSAVDTFANAIGHLMEDPQNGRIRGLITQIAQIFSKIESEAPGSATTLLENIYAAMDA